MADLALMDGETKIDTWTLNYMPKDGSRYTGKLHVTNKRLLFDAKFDNTTLDLLGPVTVEGDMLIINKADIQDIQKETSFFKKKIIVKIKGGGDFIFDYGMLSVDKLYDAAMQR